MTNKKQSLIAPLVIFAAGSAPLLLPSSSQRIQCLFFYNQSSNMKQPAVYILSSKRNGTLYVGVTSNLAQRIWQHKRHLIEGFTKKYSVTVLVYFEQGLNMAAVIAREKELKGMLRAKKIELIEQTNPYWRDLYESIL